MELTVEGQASSERIRLMILIIIIIISIQFIYKNST